MRRRFLVVAGSAVAVLVAVLVAWLLFGRAPGDEVLGNVELAGIDVGGMDRTELDEVLDRLSDGLTGEDVEVHTDDGTLLDRPRPDRPHRRPRARPPRAVLDTGRSGIGVLAWTGWLRRTRRPASPCPCRHRRPRRARRPPPRGGPDRPGGAGRAVARRRRRRAARGAPGRARQRAVRGRRGRRASSRPAATAAARWSSTVEPVSIPPRFDDDDAEALLDDADDLTAGGIQVTRRRRHHDRARGASCAGGSTLDTGTEPPVADDRRAGGGRRAGRAARPTSARRRATHPSGSRAGGRSSSPGNRGRRCCGPDAGAAPARRAARPGARGPVEVPLTVREPDRDTSDLEALHIKEKIGEFTTRHPAGQSRRGQHPPHRRPRAGPGDRARRDLLGQRLRRSAHRRRRASSRPASSRTACSSESVGGGISQFATTLFNAAFFGGLDYDEYQSHSIYISRYPYGREATLSYPEARPRDPQLDTPRRAHLDRLHEHHDHGDAVVDEVRHRRADRADLDAQRSSAPACAPSAPARTSTAGPSVDYVSATYRPAEGVGC